MSVTKIIQKNDPISIIIPSAGICKKYKKGPKALIEVAGEKLLLRQIRLLRKTFSRSEVIVVLGYGMSVIAPLLPSYVRVVENENFENTNVTRSIALGLRVATTPEVFISYGDLVFTRLSFYLPLKSCVFLHKSKTNSDAVGVNLEEGKVAHISYASELKWAQTLFLEGRELDLFRRLVYNRDNDKLFGHEIINRCIEMGGDFEAHYCNGPLLEIDSWSDIIRLKMTEEKL